jgi:3-deoxy-7-phosphoheptulonate synthase
MWRKRSAKQIESGSNAIVDVMIESNLRSGRQDLKRSYKPIYRQSITDACLSIEETLSVFHKLDEAVTRGRFGRKKKL